MKRSKVVFTVIWCIAAPFFGFCHPCRLVGRERLPAEGGLFCANHTGMSDPLCLLLALGVKWHLHVMAKAELMRIPVLGWILKQAGIFGVERGKSDIAAIKNAMKLLKNRESVLMFPEGTRIRNGVDKDGNEGEAKAGAAMLAVRTDSLLIPVFIPEKKRWFRMTKVVIGEPYKPQTESKKGSAEEYQKIADDLMDRIRALEEQAK